MKNWAGIDLLNPKSLYFSPFPEQEQQSLLLPEGYIHINPILTEPQIEQPGGYFFCYGNGRMYVI